MGRFDRVSLEICLLIRYVCTKFSRMLNRSNQASQRKAGKADPGGGGQKLLTTTTYLGTEPSCGFGGAAGESEEQAPMGD